MVSGAFQVVHELMTGHLSLLEELLTFTAMLEAEPVRRLLRLGKAPAGILDAAVVFANVVLHAGGRGVFGFGQSDLVAHGQQ